ncbi:hypothetical protein D3C86_1072030 [compost metagenome]
MAALSVHSAMGGATKRQPRFSASADRRSRSSRFAATPPATAIASIPSRSAAWIVLVTSTSTTARWNEAHTSGMLMGMPAALVFSSRRLTAVLRPLNEKSEAPSSHARGKS